jgi:hypothetical protein
MMNQRRQIFRESAMKNYWQRKQQDILPQMISPPVFLVSWILLVLLVIAGFFAWNAEIPSVASAPGLIMKQDTAQGEQKKSEIEAVIFFPAVLKPRLNTGGAIQLQVGQNQILTSKISSIEKTALSPEETIKRFNIKGPGMEEAIRSSGSILPVHVKLGNDAASLSGSFIGAKIEVGKKHVLAQLFESFKPTGGKQ